LAARVLSAYGSADGLSRAAARARRRLWWRSAGSLGQLIVSVADGFRDRRLPRPSTESVLRTEAESEAIARVLDLVRDMAPSAAKERLEEAWQEHGRQPSLLLAFADADNSAGDIWHCLAMTAEAGRSITDSLDTVCRLAWALAATYGYGTGLQVLDSLPAAARQAVEARVCAGELHLRAGNFALAVAAYGDPRDLDGFDRKRRRRCVRRASAQRLRSAVAADVEPIDPRTFDPMPPMIASVIDRGTSLVDEPIKLRELVEAAIKEHGRHPWLLLALAEVEEIQEDRHACAAAATEAMRSAPEDPLIVADAIRKLSFAGYGADALRAITDLSEDLTRSPVVRRTAGEAYRAWRLWGHAVTAFGRSGLEAPFWQMRRSSWWRSGGPLQAIRSAEGSALSSALVLPAPQAAALSALSLPVSIADAVRGDLSAYHMTRTCWTAFQFKVFDAWLRLIVLPASTVVVFAGLTIAELMRWPSAGLVSSLTAAALATAIEVTAVMVVEALPRRWFASIGVALASAVGATFLLRAREHLAFGAGLALASLAIVIAGTNVLRLVVGFGSRVRMARWQRRQAEIGVLSAILDLLGEFIIPGRRRDGYVRRGWIADLERVAVTIERDLPDALRSGDHESQGVIVAYARSAAAVLREMKKVVALPDAAGWQALRDQLSGMAGALACNDFGNWPPPVTDFAVARSLRPWWRSVVQAMRTALVIFMPPLVAYLLPLAIPLNGPGLSWLRFASVVWALLGIITLDPAWNDRIARMRQGLDLFLRASPPKSTTNSPALPGPADPALPQQTEDGPRRPATRSPQKRKRDIDVGSLTSPR
jgi:hypothetical protein